MSEYALKMNNITKRFPGVLALDSVDFDLHKGEIHALIGENGAGKSTLMKVLGGVHNPEAGSIEKDGEPVKITCPHDSIMHKIGVIYQEFNLVQTLNVYENLYLGKELKTKGLGQLDRNTMRANAKITMAKLGIEDFDCNKKIKALSVAMQQLVEIGKAIFNEIDILVMDEPTAVLTDVESHRLFDIMKGLKEKGISIVYISHRLDEVVELSDRITILRDGKYIETVSNEHKDVSKDYLVKKMVGRDLVDYYPEKTSCIKEDVVFEAKDLNKAGMFSDISFSVRNGEILGFSGLVGAGRSEVMKSIFGVIHLDHGEIFVNGEKKVIRSPMEAKNAGIAFVSEDRKREGLVLNLSLSDNISIPNLNIIAKRGAIVKRLKNQLATEQINNLGIRPNYPNRRVINFSGGNQQKCVIAKWLASNPKVIILDEPTRGIDIGAKVDIYNIINKLASENVAVVVVSSELPELLGICDRILVMSNGTITGEFSKEEFNQEAIMSAATKISEN